MSFVKNFCRLITQEDLTDEQVIDFFDVVQSVVSTKILQAHSADDSSSVAVDVISYTNSNNENIYEIVLDENIDEDEGNEISQLLLAEFADVDFDFEASVEI
jgi:hypothetical protein